MQSQVTIAVEPGIDFVNAQQVGAAAEAAGINEAESAVIVESYSEAQLQALKAGLLAAAFLALISLAFTKDLPSKVPESAVASDLQSSPVG